MGGHYFEKNIHVLPILPLFLVYMGGVGIWAQEYGETVSIQDQNSLRV